MRRRESVLLARANGDAQAAPAMPHANGGVSQPGRQSVIRRRHVVFALSSSLACFVGCNKRIDITSVDAGISAAANPADQRRHAARAHNGAGRHVGKRRPRGHTRRTSGAASGNEEAERARLGQEGVVRRFIVRVGREKRLAGAGKTGAGKRGGATPGPLPPECAEATRFANHPRTRAIPRSEIDAM